ncbi:hypothetical protein Hypma_010634 [Hypsizygus marmoreus]|uniref:Uncharacterized protein n=1 Tax=Hypsizygus marmoreus TaxID=39966 RepID=A0A369JP76_HYPMA|nr:hypothetical protein Hypma_010634 [Hypsizygus marmoreus]
MSNEIRGDVELASRLCAALVGYALPDSLHHKFAMSNTSIKRPAPHPGIEACICEELAREVQKACPKAEWETAQIIANTIRMDCVTEEILRCGNIDFDVLGLVFSRVHKGGGAPLVMEWARSFYAPVLVTVRDEVIRYINNYVATSSTVERSMDIAPETSSRANPMTVNHVVSETAAYTQFVPEQRFISSDVFKLPLDQRAERSHTEYLGLLLPIAESLDLPTAIKEELIAISALKNRLVDAPQTYGAIERSITATKIYSGSLKALFCKPLRHEEFPTIQQLVCQVYEPLIQFLGSEMLRDYAPLGHGKLRMNNPCLDYVKDIVPAHLIFAPGEKVIERQLGDLLP